MQRKRGELVPISEVVGELDGPVTAISSYLSSALPRL